MAILGIGVDLVDIARIQDMVTRKPTFPQRVLSEQEYQHYQTIKNDKRRFEYLSGRWAAKEAFGKALKKGVFPHHGFQEVSVLNQSSGAPVLETTLIDNDKYVAHISLTHTDTTAEAFVIIEEK